MIVLDTNVISELMRNQPDPGVLQWVDDQVADDLAVTAITVAEILYGIARLPEGNRRARLQLFASNMFDEFADAILPFDAEAAAFYAKQVALCHANGRATQMADAQIGAICASRGDLLATRNTKDFEHLQVELINPWSL